MRAQSVQAHIKSGAMMNSASTSPSESTLRLDCSPTNEALEQQEGNSRDTSDEFRRSFELVTTM
jgi:hypothetical protein